MVYVKIMNMGHLLSVQASPICRAGVRLVLHFLSVFRCAAVKRNKYICYNK